MNKQSGLLVFAFVSVASLPSMAGGGPADPVADPGSELALRLFAERERMRVTPAPYGLAYPVPGQFSAQALEQQNRAVFYWLWHPGGHPAWPAAPYWPPAYPMVWPAPYPWMPPPIPAP